MLLEADPDLVDLIMVRPGQVLSHSLSPETVTGVPVVTPLCAETVPSAPGGGRKQLHGPAAAGDRSLSPPASALIAPLTSWLCD